MSDTAPSIGFRDPSVVAALAVGLLCAACAIYQASATGHSSYRSPFAGWGGGESSGSYAPASAEGTAPSTTGSNPYAVRQQWGHGQPGQPGQPVQVQGQVQGQGGQGGGNPAGVGAQVPATAYAPGYAAPGISAPPPTVLAGGVGGIAAPPPSNAVGAADGGIVAPPPEQQAGVDDGGVVAPPPGQ